MTTEQLLHVACCLERSNIHGTAGISLYTG